MSAAAHGRRTVGVSLFGVLFAYLCWPAHLGAVGPRGNVAGTGPKPSVAGSGPAGARDGTKRFALSGRVSMVNSRGKPSRLAKPEDALLFFTPDRSSTEPRTPEVSEIKTVGKQFEPRLHVVRRGDRVEFPNLDPILHNVFSVSGENKFDLEVYGKGEARGHVFTHTGLVRIFCNVHREMFSHLWVLETDHIARPAPDGSFRLEDLGSGSGTLTVWHERAEAQEFRLDPATAGVLQIEIPLTRPRLPLHNNKFGKPYRRPGEY